MFSWFKSMFAEPLPPGTPAPGFSVLDDYSSTVTLSWLRGQNVVLIFYPGDDTPGCTKQLCEFREAWLQAGSLNTEVFGVNPQDARSHVKFRRKHQLPFHLLIDKGQKVATLYHANGLLVRRTVYLIGPDGIIRFSQRGMPSPAEVLKHAVRRSAAEPSPASEPAPAPESAPPPAQNAPSGEVPPPAAP